MFSFTQLLGDSLRELDLTQCVNVTDLSVRSIATYLQRLVVLRLAGCKEITDWGLLGMVETTICEPDQEMVRPASPSSLVVLHGPSFTWNSGPGPQARIHVRHGFLCFLCLVFVIWHDFMSWFCSMNCFSPLS